MNKMTAEMINKPIGYAGEFYLRANPKGNIPRDIQFDYNGYDKNQKRIEHSFRRGFQEHPLFSLHLEILGSIQNKLEEKI